MRVSEIDRFTVDLEAYKTDGGSRDRLLNIDRILQADPVGQDVRTRLRVRRS